MNYILQREIFYRQKFITKNVLVETKDIKDM